MRKSLLSRVGVHARRRAGGVPFMGHPRIIASQADFDTVATKEAASNSFITGDLGRLRNLAPTAAYEGHAGAPTLMQLDDARDFLERMLVCGFLWRYEGRETSGQQCEDEMLRMANTVTNWAEQHWLTMGESAMGMAVAWDWASDRLTSGEKTTVLTAIKSKCIDLFMARTDSERFNWAGVTNGGIGSLLMAIEGETAYEATVASGLAKIEDYWGDGGFAQLPKAAHLQQNIFNVDGGYKEGPQYWATHVRFSTMWLASYRIRYGQHSHWIADVPGLPETGNYFFDMNHPNGEVNKLGDTDYSLTTRHLTHPFGWWGKTLNNEFYRWYHRQGWTIQGSSTVKGHAAVLSVLWEDGAGVAPSVSRPLDRRYTGTDQVILRDGYGANDTYIALKSGGDSDRGHTHHDRGHVSMSALGKVWLKDFGSDTPYGDHADYDGFSSPDQERAIRWDLYRLSAQGHNTIIINPGGAMVAAGTPSWTVESHSYPDQRNGTEENGYIPVVGQVSLNGTSPYAITDLTPIYSGRSPWTNITSVKRGIKYVNRTYLLLQDEVVASSATEVWTFMHSESNTGAAGAGITLLDSGQAAEIKLDNSGDRLYCRILSPSGAVFTIRNAEPLPNTTSGQNDGNPAGGSDDPNTTWRKLSIQRTSVTSLTLCVYIEPLANGEATPSSFPGVTALSSW